MVWRNSTRRAKVKVVYHKILYDIFVFLVSSMQQPQ